MVGPCGKDVDSFQQLWAALGCRPAVTHTAWRDWIQSPPGWAWEWMLLQDLCNSAQLTSWYQFLRPELRTQSNCLYASELGNFELVNEGCFQLWRLRCPATKKSASKVWRWPHQSVLISFLLVSIPLLSGVEIRARGDKSLFQACHYWSCSLSIFHVDGDAAWDIGVSVNLSCTCLSESLVFLFHCCIPNKPVYRTQFPLLSTGSKSVFLYFVAWNR